LIYFVTTFSPKQKFYKKIISLFFKGPNTTHNWNSFTLCFCQYRYTNNTFLWYNKTKF